MKETKVDERHARVTRETLNHKTPRVNRREQRYSGVCLAASMSKSLFRGLLSISKGAMVKDEKIMLYKRAHAINPPKHGGLLDTLHILIPSSLRDISTSGSLSLEIQNSLG